MELYRTQGGSHFYGINVPGSDVDTLICDTNVLTKQSIYDEKTKDHVYRIPITETIVQLNAFMPIPQWASFLAPDRGSVGPIDLYLQENNEKIISANRKFLFGTLQRYVGELPTETSFIHFPKKSAYRLMFLEGFARYSESEKFFESIVPSDEDKLFFQKIRQSLGNYEIFANRWKKSQERLSANSQFFNNFDLAFLRENTKQLQQILGCSHSDFIQGSFALLHQIPELSILY